MLNFFIVVLMISACNNNLDNASNSPSTQINKEESINDTVIEKYADTLTKSIVRMDNSETVAADDSSKPEVELLVNEEDSMEVEFQKDSFDDEMLDTIIQLEDNEDLPGGRNVVAVDPKDFENKVDENPEELIVLDHSIWDGLLTKYVNLKGQVNYNGLLKEMVVLDNYLNLLSDNPPLPSWTKNETLAYWINVYNAFTIKLILVEYPVNSIMDVENGKAWDKRWISIGQDKLTLNEIEKDKLIKRFNEPRVHFAVNCAARSCPPILNKAWTKDNVEKQLEQRASLFINNSTYNQLSAASIKISKIFNWYNSDFGNLIDYVNLYSSIKIQDNAKIEYIEYDWSLNE